MSTITEITERFQGDTANHEMTVLHYEGLYRHLRFKSPKNSFYWFDLVTWPGSLAINGDMGSFVFSRAEDMFGFFRGNRINPQYWAEKVRAGKEIRQYSEELFKQLVTEHIEDSIADYPGLTEAVATQILGHDDIYFEQGARDLLSEFEHGATFKGHCDSCDAAVDGLTEAETYRWENGHRAATAHRTRFERIDGFRFSDVWEWDLSDYSHQFLWCCHAIQWGISQYDAGAGRAGRKTETVELPA